MDLEARPFTVPVVRELIDEGGLEVPAGVTVLLGENDSGKSTLIEAIAAIHPRSGLETSHARMSGPAVLADDHRDEAPLAVAPQQTFLEVLRQRCADPGFYLIDEPEAALSFAGGLGLIALLGELADGSHHEIAWADTDLVRR